MEACLVGCAAVVEGAGGGGGLNRDASVGKAVQRGISAAGEGRTDDQVAELIFEAGSSTAAATTDVSGRGVGMDVVRRNILDLGGTVGITLVLGTAAFAHGDEDHGAPVHGAALIEPRPTTPAPPDLAHRLPDATALLPHPTQRPPVVPTPVPAPPHCRSASPFGHPGRRGCRPGRVCPRAADPPGHGAASWICPRADPGRGRKYPRQYGRGRAPIW